MKKIVFLPTLLLLVIQLNAAIYHTVNNGWVDQSGKWKDDTNNDILLDDPTLLKNNSYTISNYMNFGGWSNQADGSTFTIKSGSVLQLQGGSDNINVIVEAGGVLIIIGNLTATTSNTYSIINDGGTVEISGNVEDYASIETKNGGTTTIGTLGNWNSVKNTNVTVGTGSIIKVNGDLKEENAAIKSFTNNGTATITGEVKVLSITNTSSLTVGTIGILNGANTIANAATINNTGSSAILNVTNNQSFSNDGYLKITNGTGATTNFKAGVEISSKTTLTNYGTVNVTGNVNIDNGTLANKGTFTVKKDPTDPTTGNFSIKNTGVNVVNDGTLTTAGYVKTINVTLTNNNKILAKGGVILEQKDACISGSGSVDYWGSITITDSGNTCPIGGFHNLPIDLIYFTGVAHATEISLNWSTASEINNDYFTLERSISDNYFSTLTTVAGAGTISTKQSYSYTDMNPYNGINYYRLSQTDYDGQTSYFAPIAVHYSNIEALIYPTVIHGDDVVNVHLSSVIENVPFQIISQDGKTIETGTISYDAELPSELFQFGVNQLIIGSDNNIITTSIVRQ